MFHIVPERECRGGLERLRCDLSQGGGSMRVRTSGGTLVRFQVPPEEKGAAGDEQLPEDHPIP